MSAAVVLPQNILIAFNGIQDIVKPGAVPIANDLDPQYSQFVQIPMSQPEELSGGVDLLANPGSKRRMVDIIRINAMLL